MKLFTPDIHKLYKLLCIKGSKAMPVDYLMQTFGGISDQYGNNILHILATDTSIRLQKISREVIHYEDVGLVKRMLLQRNFQKDTPVEAALISEHEKFMDESFKLLYPAEVMNMDYLRKSYAKCQHYQLGRLLKEHYGDDFIEEFGNAESTIQISEEL